MLEALCAEPLPLQPSSPFILMVSGGSDSTAMLLRAAQGELDLMDGCGPRALVRENLCVLHVNHCLRGAESDRDEAFVRDVCTRLGVRLVCRRVDVAAMLGAGVNLEERARQVRYGLAWELACELAQARGVAVGACRILVAHTADDRAETFLMRALSGAGIGGLSGMRPQRGIVVRPLIGSTKAELRRELDELGFGWCEDSTNAEDVATRSYVRHHVLPALVARDASFPKTLGRSLDVMAREDDLLRRLARELFGRAVRPSRPGWCVLDYEELRRADVALAARCARLALEQALGPQDALEARFEARHVEALLALVGQGSGSCSLPGEVQARVEAGDLVLRGPAAAAPPDDVELEVGGSVVWGGRRVASELLDCGGRPACEVARRRREELARAGLVEGRDFVLIDARAGAGTLCVGGPRPGERMRPFGMQGSKLLSDVLPQAGVPARDRPWVPVIRGPEGPSGERPCVWVGGIRLDGRAAWNEKTTSLIQLSIA